MANNPNISLETQQFIHQFIPSAAQLEALLWIAERQEADWSIDEISNELRSEPSLIAEALSNLQQAGLLVARGTAPAARFRYTPGSDTLRRQVDTLATLYRERRHRLLTLIYER